MNHRNQLSRADASVAVAVPSLPLLLPAALLLFVLLLTVLIGACAPLGDERAFSVDRARTVLDGVVVHAIDVGG